MDTCKCGCGRPCWPGCDRNIDCYGDMIASQDRARESQPWTVSQMVGPKEDYESAEQYRAAVAAEVRERGGR